MSCLVCSQGFHDIEPESDAQANRLRFDVAERSRDGVGWAAGGRGSRSRPHCPT